jgi:hypothetical protein
MRSPPAGSIFSVQLKHRKTERHSMCFRANGQTLIREARLVPNCWSEFCWWFSTCLWCVAFPPENRGYKHRTNAVWLTQGAFAGRRLRIRRLPSMSFYLSMASYIYLISARTAPLTLDSTETQLEVSVEPALFLSIFNSRCRSYGFWSWRRLLLRLRCARNRPPSKK